MHVCSWIDLGVTTTPLTVDEWLRPHATSSDTIAEILRDYLDATDENFEYVFYERKKDALTFIYNIVKKASRSHMEEAVFTGITVEPSIDLVCPEEGTSIVAGFLEQTQHDMKFPMLPALHYEQIPSRLCTADCLGSYAVPLENAVITRGALAPITYAPKMMHLVPWSTFQNVDTPAVHAILKPEILLYNKISFADAVRECLDATAENFEQVFAQQKTMAVALIRELLAFGDYNEDYEPSAVKITGLTAEAVNQLRWPDTGKPLLDEVAAHCDAPIKWPNLPALHLEHGVMDADYGHTDEIVPIYAVPLENIYLSFGKLKLYGYNQIRRAHRP